ncbi:MAG: hypothetical protein KA146_12685 [Leptospiraceae bacterium]|nr:hypothetical protein [Leptospiraceae bacterium]
MNSTNAQEFPKEVIAKLQYYVYRLIDPRNGETFYVGKGNGNRVFSHIKDESTSSESFDELTDKLKKIREIKNAGLEVNHIIHRHGMDEDTAIEVEAALIDAYPGVTNIIGGYGNNDMGSMHYTEIIRKYKSEEAKIKHKAILININRTSTDRDIYNATRYAWKIDKKKAEKAELILSTFQGIIIGVFTPTKWLEATPENFPDFPDMLGRFGFIGKDADESVKKQYLMKRVPDSYRKKGAANPIKYTYK